MAVLLEGIVLRAGETRLNSVVYSAYAALALFASLLSSRFRFPTRLDSPTALFGLYLLLASTSSIWSHIGLQSIAQVTPIALTYLAILVLPRRWTPDIPTALVHIGVAVAATSWILLALAPSLAASTPYMWRLNGVMGHPQRLALLMCTSLLAWLALNRAGKTEKFFRSSYIPAALLLVTLIATQARAFIVFFLITAGFFYTFDRKRNATFVLTAIAVLMAVGIAALNHEMVLAALQRAEGNDATLSGRTTIWVNALELAKQNALFGYGFGSFYSDLTSGFFATFIAPHAHNDAINVFFELGVFGLILISLFMLTLVTKFHRVECRAGLYLVLFYGLCGLTGVLLGGKISLPMVIILLLLRFPGSKENESTQQSLLPKSSHA